MISNENKFVLNSSATNNTFIEINLKNIIKNYKIISKELNSTTKCSAVVKANAYGLGLIEVSNALAKAGCNDFWVSNLEEAVMLRSNRLKENIYILHGVKNTEFCEVALKYNLIPVLNDYYQFDLWKNYARAQNKQLNCVLNVDTGLGRLGFELCDIDKLLHSNQLHYNYLMSHLACSDDQDHHLNKKQLKEVQAIAKQYPNIKITFANSSGIFLGEQYHFNMVRTGGALYGVNPIPNQPNLMKTAVNLKAAIIQKRIVTKNNQNIGYSGTYNAKQGDKLLTLEYGYYDGYSRSLSNKFHCYANGYYLPIIGLVSMDLLIVDASKLPDNIFNTIEFVELLGENIKVEEIAKQANTDEREIFSNLANRCKRVYT